MTDKDSFESSAQDLPATWSDRSSVPEIYRWRLEDIFATDPDWETALKQVSQLADKLVQYKGKLHENSVSFLKAVDLSDQIDQELSEIIAYARMRRDENNTIPKYQDMTDRAMSLHFKVAEQTAFLTPEITQMDEKMIFEFVDNEKGLEKYRHMLENLCRQRPHILDEEKEKLLTQFGSVSQGIEDIHTMLDNADIRLGSIEDENGSQIEITMARFAQLRDNPDRRVRADAFASVHNSYAALGNTLAALYSTQVKSDFVHASARKFISTEEAALFSDKLSPQILDNLFEAIHQALPTLNSYFDLRQRLMGLDKLHIYDTYVPITRMPQRRYSFAQACEMVTSALRPLGPEYIEALEKHLSDRWIDVYETPSKTSGAYSWGTYKSHPYVLMNYSGTLSDVFTLAHELGHSLHTWFSSRRPFVQSHYPIFLAEIASTVNENLLIRYLLDQCDAATAEGRQEKAWLLNHQLEEFRLTVFRQTMFAEFESKVHALSQKGEALNADSLNRIYGLLLREYFGPDLEIDDYMVWEWSRIPHFFNSFYVFKYATGFTSAIAIAGKILDHNKEYVSRYLDFLSAGGSDYPLELLCRAGVDLTLKQPFSDAMQVFSATLQEFAELSDL